MAKRARPLQTRASEPSWSPEILPRKTSCSSVISSPSKVAPSLLKEYCEMHVARLNVLDRHPGPTNVHSMISICERLSILYRLQNRYAEAQVFAGRLIELRQDLFGHDHSDTLRSKSNLAVLLGYQGRYEEALGLLSAVYNELRYAKRADHPWTRRALHNYAMAAAACGKVQEAKALLQWLGCTIDKQHEDQQQTLASRNSLDWLQRTQEQNHQRVWLVDGKRMVKPGHNLRKEHGTTGTVKLESGPPETVVKMIEK